MDLTAEQKKFLLKLARESISARLEDRDLKYEKPTDPDLVQRCGAFVTLHTHGQLRGCIGFIEGFAPLYETVFEMARKAAFNDFRFHPVTEEEFSEIDIEISVLSPLQKITDISMIIPGRHGLVISKGNQKGLLLPQVAAEHKWDRETFLKHTCQKAGLPENAFFDADAGIEIFTATVFGELDPA